MQRFLHRPLEDGRPRAVRPWDAAVRQRYSCRGRRSAAARRRRRRRRRCRRALSGPRCRGSRLPGSSSRQASSGFMNSGTSSPRRVFGLIDLVEVVHPAGELRRDRPLGPAFLLLEAALAPFLPFGGAGGPKLRSRPAAARRRRQGADRRIRRAADRQSRRRAAARRTRTAAGRHSRRRTTVAAGPWTAGPVGRGRRIRRVRAGATEAAAGARRTAGSAIVARARFADRQRPAHEQLPVELLDGRFRRVAIGVFDERKSTRAAGFAIERPHDLRGLADSGEMRPQVVFCGLIREIAYE